MLKIIPPLIFCLFALITSCTSSNDAPENKVMSEPVDSFESALPHGAALPTKELSEVDKLKLAKASGKEAILVSLDSLQQIIKNDSSGWTLYQFWNLDCAQCLELNNHLHAIETESDLNFNLRYVNTIEIFPEQVNAYIREKGLIREVFSIPGDTLTGWANEIYPSWNGELPAILLINNQDGTQLFYQQTFMKEELQAILETLSL